jgi:hypothetical protein
MNAEAEPEHVNTDRDEDQAPDLTPPEETRPTTLCQASGEAVSNGPQNPLKRNRFSIIKTSFRVFILPPAPSNDPASTTRFGILLKPRSWVRRSQPSRQDTTNAAIEGPLGNGRRSNEIVAAGTTATNRQGRRRHVNSSINVAVRHETAFQCTLPQSNEFEQLEKDFFVATTMDVPEELHQRWEEEVLPHLTRDRGVFGMSLGLKTHEINGHEELKMAGSEGSRAAMKPTVIISCRSEVFKRKFEVEVNRWEYVKNLGVNMKTILETQTRWAASPEMASEGPVHADPGPAPRLFSCQIERVVGHGSACGLRLKFVVDFGGSQSTRLSVLGGLILVGDKVYGLTTGHSIVAWLAQPSASSTRGSNSDNLVSLDSDRLPKDNISPVRNRLTSQDSNLRLSSGTKYWRDITWREPFVFAGQYFAKGEVQSPVWDDEYLNSDWALVAVDDHDFAENSYQGPNGAQVVISEIVPLDQLGSGPVLVLSGPDRTQAGFLSQNSSVLHMGKSAFRVRQIAMDESIGMYVPFPMMFFPLIKVCETGSGGSGSWVVRGGRLCGYIVAIQDGSPWVYMLPIDGVFKDIASVTGSKPVRLISKNDIKTVKPRENPDRELSSTLTTGTEANPAGREDKSLPRFSRYRYSPSDEGNFDTKTQLR